MWGDIYAREMKRRANMLNQGSAKRQRIIASNRVTPYAAAAEGRRRVAQNRRYARLTYGGLAPGATRGYTPNPVEKKVFDINPANIDVNSTPSISPLCIPTIGADMTNRVGRKICIKSLYVRGYVGVSAAVSAPAAASVAGQVARMILLWDSQPNGSSPAITDILQSSGVSSQINLNNRERFKILADKVYVFDPMQIVFTAGSQIAMCNRTIYPVKKYIKLNNEVVFNSTNGGTVADIASGNLVMVWLGSVSTGPSDCIANLSTRVRFTDV